VTSGPSSTNGIEISVYPGCIGASCPSPSMGEAG